MNTDVRMAVNPWSIVLAGLVGGGLVGALYAALAGGVHRVVYGRWDSVPAFAAATVVTAAGIGLAVSGGLALAVSARRLWPRAFTWPLLVCGGLLLLAGLFGPRLLVEAGAAASLPRWPLLLALAGLACLLGLASFALASGAQGVRQPGRVTPAESTPSASVRLSAPRPAWPAYRLHLPAPLPGGVVVPVPSYNTPARGSIVPR